MSNSIKEISKNRKAFFDYFIIESTEAGIELCGTEVKSIRQGGVNLKDAWCDIDNGELYVKQMHISPYEKGNIFNQTVHKPSVHVGFPSVYGQPSVHNFLKQSWNQTVHKPSVHASAMTDNIFKWWQNFCSKRKKSVYDKLKSKNGLLKKH